MDDADRAQVVLERQENALQRYLRGVRARMRPAGAGGPRHCLGCGHEMDGTRDVLPGACLCFACQDDAERAMGR